MKRTCPNCTRKSVSLQDLLFGDSRCTNCRRIIGVHRVAALVSSIVIFSITTVTTLVVFIELGLYAALLWFTFPVGALSYLKARFCPLVARPGEPRGRDAHGIAHRTG